MSFKQLQWITGAILMVAGCVSAQSSVRTWGSTALNTEAYALPTRFIAPGGCVIREDGRAFVPAVASQYISPALYEPPPPPSGLRYIGMSVGKVGMGLLSDGTIVGWGDQQLSSHLQVPSLPVGVRYTKVSCGFNSILALRSDGQVVHWPGVGGVLTLPPGVRALDVHCGYVGSLILLSDGAILASGALPGLFGELGIPPLPPGVTYDEMFCGDYSINSFFLARRSDGQVVAWGDNTVGQLNVPALPTGMTYLDITVGHAHALALRSDGQLIAWGDNSEGQCNVPAMPPGVSIRQMTADGRTSYVLLSNGEVLAWGGGGTSHPLPRLGRNERWVDVAASGRIVGITNHGEAVFFTQTLAPIVVPALPAGMRYSSVNVGSANVSLVRSDGELFVFGDNHWGQANVPPLPPGVGYVQAAHADDHTVALRSDGTAVVFGGSWGSVPIPNNPPGVTYTKVDAGDFKTLLLRSDGEITYLGDSSSYQANVPALPTGVDYVDVAGLGSGNGSVALRSDGRVVAWGPGHYLPLMTAGIYYVEVSGGDRHSLLRRSDGQVDVGGNYLTQGETLVPTLAPGESVMQVSADNRQSMVRIGPTSTYVRFGTGCSSTLSPGRLVPRDTPRIGHTLRVTSFDLPLDVAVMMMSLDPIAPVSLAGLGMPGCTLHVGLDVAVAIVGQHGNARFELPIPNMRSLIGLHFYQQAAVLDPAANAFGFALSEAMEGVIGDW